MVPKVCGTEGRGFEPHHLPLMGQEVFKSLCPIFLSINYYLSDKVKLRGSAVLAVLCCKFSKVIFSGNIEPISFLFSSLVDFSK